MNTMTLSADDFRALADQFANAAEAIAKYQQVIAERDHALNNLANVQSILDGMSIDLAKALRERNEENAAVASLRSELTDADARIQAVWQQHDEKAAALHVVKEQLAEAECERDTYRNEATALREELRASADRVSSLELALTYANSELDLARKERDEYGMKHLAAVDDATAVRKELSNFRTAVNNVFGSVRFSLNTFEEATSGAAMFNPPSAATA